MTSNSRLRVALVEAWLDPAGHAVFAERADLERRLLDPAAGAEAAFAELALAHGYHVHSARHEVPAALFVTEALLARCAKLLAITTAGSGYDTVDLAACTEAGVLAINQAGGNRQAVAEHTLAMMLSLGKRIAEANLVMRRERIQSRTDFKGRDLFGKTLGIVGLGQIGSRVAEICATALRMTVLAYDPYLSAAQCAERHALQCGLDDVLAGAEVVSVHCPLTDETRGMFGAAEFARMRPGAFFVSTARGGIHDEDALYAALDVGHLGGAGLDVWAEEPPRPEHPLLRLDNVIASPHTAGLTTEARQRVGTSAARQMLQALDGERPANLLNPEAWPRFAARRAAILRL